MNEPGDSDRRSRGPFGPMEMLDDVQRQALDAAMRVASELGSLGGDLADASWLRGFGIPGTDADDRQSGSRSGNPTGTPVDVGRLRGDVVRAAETFAELVRSLLDVGFDALDELARRPVPQPAGSAPPGSIATVECAIRNDRGETVRGARPLVPGLVSGSGAPLDAVVSVQPEQLDLDAHERVVVTVEVHVSPVAVPGRYHGLLVVSGLADTAIPVSITVVDVASPSDDDD